MKKLLTSFAACGLLAQSLCAEPQIKIYTLSNRPAAATVDIVRSLLGPGESVWSEDRLERLIVKAGPERQAEIQKRLQELDVPAPQVWLLVNQSGSRPVSGAGGGVALAPGNRVVVGAQAYDVQQNVNETQKLLVMSGGKGQILIGQDLPYVQPYWAYAHGLGLGGQVMWQRVSTGFSVEPTVVGDTVRMRITPWLSYVGAGGNGQIEFSESATSLVVKDGQTVTISSSTGSQSRQGSAFGLILGGGSQQMGNSSSVTVTAQIQMPTP